MPLLQRYGEAGLRPVVAMYGRGRHEMLNEINNAEVQRDLLGWLDKSVLSPRQG
jgi:alpha-beta hydrolase superfamily lysophospholipase